MKQVYNHYFPTPKFLAMPSCALDISDESIKYGELVPHENGFRLGRYGQEKIPSGIVVSGKIQDEKRLAEILSAIKRKEKIKFVRIALPEEQMYLFTLTLPNQPDAEMRETILLQLEEHIPLFAPEAVFDYDVIKEDGAHAIVQVTATAANLIDSYLSVFEKAGLVPLSFELEAQAIARSIVPAGSTGAVMIVDFGKTRTSISIVDNGRALFTSTFDMGGQIITEMMAKSFNMSLEEAEKVKRSYGTVGAPSGDDIFPIIINNLSVMRDELNKHYLYWHSHEGEDGQPRSKIEKIILCGGDSNLYGIISYLESSMSIPVEYANTWVNITDIKTNVPVMPFDISLSFATVFGLALGDYSKQ